MPLLKNVASQKVPVYAYDADGNPVTGDAANITAQISKDYGASAAVADTNPTELDATNHPGWYVFDLTQAEINADVVIITPKSVTVGVFFSPALAYPTVYTGTRAGYLDELGAANIPADIDSLLTRLSAARAGYLDNLSAGAVALEATLTDIMGAGWSTETLKAIKEYVDSLESRLTASRATALDNIAGAYTLVNIYSKVNEIRLLDVPALTVEINANEAKIDTVDGVVDAIKLKTDNLPGDPADQSAVESAISAAVAPLALEANVQGHAAAALTAYDPPTRAELSSDKNELIVYLLRLLGLSHENAFIDQITYNDNGRREGARLRTYSAAGSVGTDNDVLASYAVTVSWDANGRLETYQVVRAA